jgi:hypothetical protein
MGYSRVYGSNCILLVSACAMDGMGVGTRVAWDMEGGWRVEADGRWGEPVAIGWTRRCWQRWFLEVGYGLSGIGLEGFVCNP